MPTERTHKKKTKVISRILLSGVGLCIGLVSALGIYFLVQAVAPGTVKSPSFDPGTNDVQLGIECVTGWMENGTTLFTAPSTLNATLDPTQVIERVSASTVRCKFSNGWYMTGCSMFCSGGQTVDESMVGFNACSGTCGATPSLYIRCCHYPS
ncbi:MAG: hypothetical protein AAB490_06520 [Patescibacteria group bacterium]